MDAHESFIKKCIELAGIAKGQGESPVGAILVKNGQILAEGIESGKGKNDITCHAEIEVIRNLKQKAGVADLSEYTMYTTHEPCIMCSYVIRHHKISTIVWSISSGDIGGYNSAYPILKDNTIKKWGNAPTVIEGILKEECLKLFEK